MSHGNTNADFFEDKYLRNSDPWEFASSKYELTRYSIILDALKDLRYQRAFEPGCSIGVLTERLAPFCDDLFAMDISPTAVSRARRRCRTFPRVHVSCGEFPSQIPDGTFDLIILSEIGYYFDRPALKQIARTLLRRLRSCGSLIAAHWLGQSCDHILSGDEVHEELQSSLELTLRQSDRYAGFRLDRWVSE